MANDSAQVLKNIKQSVGVNLNNDLFSCMERTEIAVQPGQHPHQLRRELTLLFQVAFVFSEETFFVSTLFFSFGCFFL